tara:strand:+ start:5588 stop:6997 length:1410 start_codon:yes stop_codon:yes gene_type:complete
MAKNTKLNRRNIRNRDSSRQNFNLRKQYLNEVVPTNEFNNFFDSSRTPYYGKVDHNANVVYPSENYLATLSKNADFAADTVYALNFVADAFHDLQDHFNKANQAGILAQDANEIHTISPVGGWESVHSKHNYYIKGLYGVLVTSYFETPNEANGLQNAKPTNFDQYMNSIKRLYKKKGSRFPLSRSSYILSNNCSRHISGLAIEISPSIDYSDDASKNFTYIESSNFTFYMNALKKFGFMADKDYPGRIIADLGSPNMQAYMAPYNVTFDNLFDMYYYKAKDYDYDLISIYLMQFYINYTALYPIMSETTSRRAPRLAPKYVHQEGHVTFNDNAPIYTSFYRSCISKTEVIQRDILSDLDIASKYNQDFWIPIYIELLNYELKSPLNEHQITKTIKNAKDLKKNVDFDAAIGYIGDKFNFYRYPLRDLALANYEDIGKTSSGGITTTRTTSASPSNGGGASGTGGSGGY